MQSHSRMETRTTLQRQHQRQEQGEWSTNAWNTYVVEDEVERLRRFGQVVDESSDSEASDNEFTWATMDGGDSDDIVAAPSDH